MDAVKRLSNFAKEQGWSPIELAIISDVVVKLAELDQYALDRAFAKKSAIEKKHIKKLMRMKERLIVKRTQ